MLLYFITCDMHFVNVLKYIIYILRLKQIDRS